MRYTTAFFDLDDTLYSSHTGLWGAIRARMSEYMLVRLGISADEVPALRRRYYELYGTTLRGLQKHHQVDPEDFLAYVHDLPLERFIQPDLQVRALLLSLPQHRWIFTNADSAHARRVLAVLNLGDLFDGIADVRSLGFACKPEAESYRLAMRMTDETDPQRCVLIDDSPRNLAGARRLGVTTVLVAAEGSAAGFEDGVDFCIPDLLALRAALPQLWEE